MKKAELVALYNEGKIKEVAGTHITNTSGIAIIEVLHGFEDYVFGYVSFGDTKLFFKVKIHYSIKAFIMIRGTRYNMDEFLRF